MGWVSEETGGGGRGHLQSGVFRPAHAGFCRRASSLSSRLAAFQMMAFGHTGPGVTAMSTPYWCVMGIKCE